MSTAEVPKGVKTLYAVVSGSNEGLSVPSDNERLESRLFELSKFGKEPESEEGLLHVELEGKTVRERVKTLSWNYMAYYDGIYDTISNDTKVPVSAEDGINVMRIIEAAIQSNDQKRTIVL